MFTYCSISGTLILLYLFAVDVDVDCTAIFILTLIPALANKLCFLPVVFDRLLFIVLPFDYKRVVTNNVVISTICTIWLVIAFLTVVIVISTTTTYLPPLGNCIATGNSLLLQTFTVVPQLATVLGVIITSIYFRYKIFKSNKFFKENTYTNTVERRKAISAGLLLDTLWKELKPTLSVLIMGGVDGLFNFLVPIIWLGGRLVFTEDPYLRKVYTKIIIIFV